MTASTELFSTADASPFGRRQRRARGARIPVTVVTGFLGSGKTTLIRELLRRPEGANTAVVINEYGEVGIDNALLRASSDATVLLGNGCLCCTVRTDLQESSAHAVRRPGARRGAEFRAGHHRNQRSRRSRPGVADLRQRPRARRGISSPGAGNGRRCAERRGQPRPDARGAASGGAGRPHRAEQDRCSPMPPRSIG